jgi:hypothetical protein
LNFKIWKMGNYEKIRKVAGPLASGPRRPMAACAGQRVTTHAWRCHGGSATTRHLTPMLSVGHRPVFLAVHVRCCRSLILCAASRRRQSSICLAAPLHRHHSVLHAATQSPHVIVSLPPPPPSRAAHGAELERATARATFTPRCLAELQRATPPSPLRSSAPSASEDPNQSCCGLLVCRCIVIISDPS